MVADRSQIVLDGLFILGASLSVLKGADLLLREHQRRWLQQRFEFLTLWLEYLRPLPWFQRVPFSFWATLGLFVTLTVAVLAVVVAFLTGAGTIAVFESNWLLQVLIHGPLFLLSTGGAVLWSYITLHQVLDDGRTFRDFLVRFVTILGLSVLLHALNGVGTYGYHRLFAWLFGYEVVGVTDRSLLHFYVTWSGLGATLTSLDGFNVLIGATVTVIVGLLVIVLQMVLLLLEGLVALLRAIAWRVAEYQKGVWAALVLLITISLGIAELYLRAGDSPR